jgi:RNA polymerase sigma-70 factor (sigma-E family)
MKRLDSLGPEFDAFVRASATPLMRTAVLLVGDRVNAEDLVQLALLRTASRWSVANRAPTAYARRVLVNLAKDNWRNRSRRPKTVVSSAPLPEPMTEADAEIMLLRDELLAALVELPLRQRAVLVLRYLEDLPVADVARIVGCAEGTVRSQTHHGLIRMRTVLTALDAPGRTAGPPAGIELPDNDTEEHHAYR